MDVKTYNKSISGLVFQRNLFAFLLLLQGAALVITLSLLLTKHERIIVAPPQIEKEFWVEGTRVSPTYLEQHGSFLSQLLLSKSPQSAAMQNRIVMRYVDASFAQQFSAELTQEEKKMASDNLSYTFFPSNYHVFPERLQVEIDGERLVYLDGKQLAREPKRYQLSFGYSGGMLKLRNLSRLDLPKGSTSGGKGL
jgi:conjugal transfer pilus assembly protein TraE